MSGEAPTLGAWLRTLRERALLSQEELAARSGLSVGTISGIEAGRIRRPRRTSLRLLADALALTGSDREALLAGRAQPDRTATPAVQPQQLPSDVATFTGRERELQLLEEALAAAGAGPVVISAIEGAGGIGKSALAIHAAYRLADHFPDGQLYVDLHGATAGLEPLAPLEVLARFLRALGMEPAAIPTDVAEAAAAFRSRLADRRMLVVLDNARDAAQVRPLLPGASSCGAVVTSRRTLSSLDGAQHLHLDVLPEAEAIDLFGRLAGQQRVTAEPDAAKEIVRCCGCLPLALRIAGARVATRPTWPLGILAQRLTDQQRRLDELELADIGVRASFAVSHHELATSTDPRDRAAAHAFTLLGLPDGPDIGIPAAARLLNRAEDDTEHVLEQLVDAHLLDTATPGRYRLHDLLRLYAHELAFQQHTEAARAAALTRAFGLYVATAWNTLAILRPGDPRLDRADHRWQQDTVELADPGAALEWLEAERANLLAAAQQATIMPGIPSELSAQLAHGLFGFVQVRSYWLDGAQINQTALEVARRTGSRTAEAQIHNDLGIIHWRQGRTDQALTHIQESVTLSRTLGDNRSQAGGLGNLALIYDQQGRYEQALTSLQEALTLYRELGDLHSQAVGLGNLGLIYERQGRHEQALAAIQEGLAIHQKRGYRHGQAIGLHSLGVVYQQQGEYENAVTCLHESLAICRDLGDLYGQAFGLYDLSLVYQRQGRHEQALASLGESLTIRRKLNDHPGQAQSLRFAGVSLWALGRHDEARARWSEALAILEELQSPEASEIRVLLSEHSGQFGNGAM